MDQLLLQTVEVAFVLANDFQCEINKYGEILKATCQGSYEQVLSNDLVCRLLIPLSDSNLSWTCTSEHNLASYVSEAVRDFVDVDSKEDLYLRQLVVLCIGVSSLQLFVQNNWVGPPTSCSVSQHLSALCENAVLTEYVHSCLAVDDGAVYQLSTHPVYLFIAKTVLWTCYEHISDCQTAGFWQLRLIKTLQALLDKRSSTLKDLILQRIVELSTKPIFNGSVANTVDVRMQFNLEAGHLCYYYYESTTARHHFRSAEQLSQLNVELTGMLGKRTRFQQNDLPQLILQVTYSDSCHLEDSNSESHLEGVDGKWLPTSVKLDDESVLDEITFKNPETSPRVAMTAVQQAMILGLCHNHRRTHESEGQSRIVQEELMAFINCVLAQPVDWCVQTMALLLRSRWEKDSARRIQRSLSQIEELVKQIASHGMPGHSRLSLVYAVSLPPRWTIEQELGRLYDEIGSVSSALDVYLRLHSWEDVIACYSKLGHREKAETLIRQQLAVNETANLWCHLGDVTSDPQHYHRALELSRGRSAQSQRALAYYHFNRHEMKESLQYFDKSLQISPLQIGVWFTYGCACLECQEYSRAATGFRRCVNLDTDNFAAWSNLATAYIKANNKPRAFLTYQEALKCDFENWRIWENYLAVATDIGEFEEAMKAYHRLLELRNKHTDVAVLGVLVRAVCEQMTDASGDPATRLRPKLLKLFGHVTACITSSADIWSLYAKLLTSDGTADATTVERTLQCLKAAHSCSLLNVNWEKDIQKCVEMCNLSHELATAYLRCASCSSESAEINRIKSSGRLMLKGIVAKLQKQQTDAWSGSLPAELDVAMRQLNDDLVCLSDVTER